MKCIAITLALLLPLPALAHDHNQPNFDSWYQSLERPDLQGRTGFGGYGGGISCCNKTDCHETEAEIRGNDWWARLVVVKNGVEEKLDFVRVPPEKVIHNKANPTGSPVICHTLSWVGNHISADSAVIYCFIPGFET
jgi:hypothetical protein